MRGVISDLRKRAFRKVVAAHVVVEEDPRVLLLPLEPARNCSQLPHP
jgi:hypothetical protein